jgi:hypothetical protein
MYASMTKFIFILTLLRFNFFVLGKFNFTRSFYVRKIQGGLKRVFLECHTTNAQGTLVECFQLEGRFSDCAKCWCAKENFPHHHSAQDK